MTSLMPPQAAPSRRPSTAAIVVPVVLTGLVSVALAFLGLMALAFSALCHDPGPGARADACASLVVAFGFCAIASVVVPVVIGVAGARARDRATYAAWAIAATVVGYLPAAVTFAVAAWAPI